MIDEIDDVIAPQVTVSGRYPTLTRIKTNLLSLDLALASRGNLGLPLRVITELYGRTNTGKSTLSYYLAGRVASAITEVSSEPGEKVSVADVEMADLSYIPRAIAMSGFKGQVDMMDLTDEKGVIYPHEKILMRLAKSLLREDVRAILWDSVGATVPMVEMDTLTEKKDKSQFGEAFMGKKAKLVTQIVQAFRTALISKKTPSTAIAINHVHGVLGGHGHTTTGGERLRFLAGVRIMLWPLETFRVKDDDYDSPVLGYLVSGQVEKLRFGAKAARFQFYIVPNFGVHPGVTAMFDAFNYGLAERGKTGFVKLNGKNLGRLKGDLLAYALEGRLRKFYPFQELTREYADKVERGEIDAPIDIVGSEADEADPSSD